MAIARASPPDRQRLITAAEAAAPGIRAWHRAKLLAAIACACPPERERLLADAEKAAMEVNRSVDPLVAIANSNPPALQLGRLEAAAADLEPRDRPVLLAAIAAATPDPADRRRLLATTLSSMITVDMNVISTLVRLEPRLSWALMDICTGTTHMVGSATPK